jgi:uncharacterized protein YyaL (SSP411 family)
MGCKSQEKKEPDYKFTNSLINESSPYLLQHAHNPVNWHAWNDETLALAKDENKLLLISVGYAACHWCHVMEEESFENEEVAQLMNANFICVKVDREERPDVDKIYMDAVQLLKGNGGWPLNAIALPDGKPFWGGTYFPKEDWVDVLTKIATMWREEPDKIQTFADELTNGIKTKSNLTFNPVKKQIKPKDINSLVANWKNYFDPNRGGYRQAPKFPMPTNYHYLLRHAVQNTDNQLLTYVNTTLTQMAFGGIYDHIGGGFSRYSTDAKWHIPHFEKMLYDNAQLVSLYADAYLVTKNKLYKKVVYESLDFVNKELTDSSGAFYSSLDADSLNDLNENEEGAFYCWKEKQLKELLGNDFQLFKEYYNINEYGLWEDDNYVLIRKETEQNFITSRNISIEKLKIKLINWKKLLYQAREQRERPRLDDKVLTSWNALMLKAYVDAYRVFDDEKFLKIAIKNANFMLSKVRRKEGGINRNYKNGKSNINAYLEDYAALIDAFISLYEVTLEEKWIEIAKELTEYTFLHFYDKEIKLFYFTSDQDNDLVSRSIEITDNVIPASNSIMARNLLKLGHLFANKEYLATSQAMLNNVIDKAKEYAPSYSNWMQLAADFSGNYYEVAISGKDALKKLKEFNQNYIPNKMIVGSIKSSQLPLLENRYNEGATDIYICVDSACQMPTNDVQEAIKQINIKISKD